MRRRDKVVVGGLKAPYWPMLLGACHCKNQAWSRAGFRQRKKSSDIRIDARFKVKLPGGVLEGLWKWTFSGSPASYLLENWDQKNDRLRAF